MQKAQNSRTLSIPASEEVPQQKPIAYWRRLAFGDRHPQLTWPVASAQDSQISLDFSQVKNAIVR